MLCCVSFMLSVAVKTIKLCIIILCGILLNVIWLSVMAPIIDKAGNKTQREECLKLCSIFLKFICIRTGAPG
jgi:hypothetical protein